MSRRRLYRPYRVARRVLVVTVGLAAIAGAVFYLSRDRETAPRPEASDRVLRPGSRIDLVMAGEGFDYEVVDGERRLFRLLAEEIVSDSEGLIGLSEVQLEIDRDNGDRYTVFSDRGVYQVESSIARLEDNVRVVGPDGFELRTAGLEVVRGGNAIESTAPVLFRLGSGLSGRARRLFYHLDRNRVRLNGAARVESREPGSPPATLRADLLVYDRDDLFIRAEGGVRVTSGPSFVAADRMSVRLANEAGELEFIRARWNVAGTLRSRPSNDLGRDTTFRGKTLSVAFAGGEAKSAELDSGGGESAEIESIDDSGLSRRLVAPNLSAELVAGELDIVRAWSGVEIVESLPYVGSAPVRRVCTEWLLATFTPDGGIARMALHTGVDYQEPGLQATGERIQAAGAGETLDLFGAPAVVRSDRGRFEAPRITWRGEAGAMRAVDGVRAELPEGGRFGLLGKSGKGPIRLTSREAQWEDEPPIFTFVGEVRAWQNEDYLLADRLEGDRNGDRLTASGDVKTVVRPPPEGEENAGGARIAESATTPADEDPGAAADRAPIEVSADELVYTRPARLATYSGSARAYQAGRSLVCDTLDVTLGDDDRFERLVCVGDEVRIRNPDRGHTVRGREATYLPSTSEVRISGSPVILEDGEGGVIRGPYMIYDLEAGTAQIVSPPRPASLEEGDADAEEAPA